MHVVPQKMTLVNLALSLPCQLVEDLSERLSDLLVDRLPAALGYPDNVVLAVPNAVA
jgi:hypothetical protein